MTIYSKSLFSLYKNINNSTNISTYYLTDILLNNLLNTNSNIITHILSNYRAFTLPSNSSNIFLRIERKKSFFSTSYEYIGYIDIYHDKINDSLKIDSYGINNNADNFESCNVKHLMFDFAVFVAKKYNCQKIDLDVHKNLNYYKKDKLDYFGFILTDKIAKDNPYWITTTKIL